MKNILNEVMTGVEETIVIVLLIGIAVKFGFDVSWMLIFLTLPPIALTVAILSFIIMQIR